MNRKFTSLCAIAAAFAVASNSTGLLAAEGQGENRSAFKDLPSHAELVAALKAIVAEENAGIGLNMWATIVDRDGVVARVAFSGQDRGDQWPGSRVISAQKANTANAFSLANLALSTANLIRPSSPAAVSSACRRAIPWTRPSPIKDPPKTTASTTILWSAAKSAA